MQWGYRQLKLEATDERWIYRVVGSAYIDDPTWDPVAADLLCEVRPNYVKAVFFIHRGIKHVVSINAAIGHPDFIQHELAAKVTACLQDARQVLLKLNSYCDAVAINNERITAQVNGADLTIVLKEATDAAAVVSG